MRDGPEGAVAAAGQGQARGGEREEDQDEEDTAEGLVEQRHGEVPETRGACKGRLGRVRRNNTSEHARQISLSQRVLSR
ncbi:hypothetical protein N867_03805 [Actinotalea fermentans ATCC 43279 = JCM 9966 = DSM 3133]|uniref:Uncharacterized protein n=1 Tax=Actinotalea fermentans TaxID=43671 RepID=A0A511YWK0_9CELL|nr:hypothetical protein N867_03805 [Actinotalea fermentans ATCC 43279 = JCM 9966 = DSM 3133]GEN79565.1 hypothetical protein AFE02nite_12990 [Actinotalea fermentans]